MAGGLFSGSTDDTEVDNVVDEVVQISNQGGTSEASPGGLFGDGTGQSVSANRTANEAANNAEEYAEDSKGWAIGNDPDTDLDGWSDTNNSKYYSEESADSATAAAASQASAANSATSASNSATAAASSATNAATSESNASDSAAAAASSATDSANSASAANANAVQAAQSAASADASRVAAETAEANAETAEANAEAAEMGAETAEANAQASATTAANSASMAATSETNADNSATAAADSADDAELEATRAQGWAIGDTSVNEDDYSATNNSKYWSDQAQAIYEDLIVEYEDTVTATANTLSVTMSNGLPEEALVFLNGVLLEDTTDYSISGNVITFTETIYVDDVVTAIRGNAKDLTNNLIAGTGITLVEDTISVTNPLVADSVGPDELDAVIAADPTDDAGKALTLNSLGTGLVWADADATPSWVPEDDPNYLTEVPSDAIGPDEINATIADTPADDAGKVLTLNSAGTGVEWTDVGNDITWTNARNNTDSTNISNIIVASNTGLEIVENPDGTLTLQNYVAPTPFSVSLSSTQGSRSWFNTTTTNTVNVGASGGTLTNIDSATYAGVAISAANIDNTNNRVTHDVSATPGTYTLTVNATGNGTDGVSNTSSRSSSYSVYRDYWFQTNQGSADAAFNSSSGRVGSNFSDRTLTAIGHTFLVVASTVGDLTFTTNLGKLTVDIPDDEDITVNGVTQSYKRYYLGNFAANTGVTTDGA